MKNPIDQLTNSANEIRLSTEASKRIRERLVSHMRVHPASAQPVHSPYQRFFDKISPFAASFHAPVAAFGLLLVIVLGGATTFGAAGALPGNPLYLFKVKIIEPAQGLLAVTPEAQAEFQIALVKTRIHEVEQLAAREQLTSEQQKQGQERFDASLEVSQATLAELSEKDPEAAAKIEVSFADAISRHEDDLNEFSRTRSSTSAERARSFALHIRSKTDGGRMTTLATLDAPLESAHSAKMSDPAEATLLTALATSTEATSTLSQFTATSTEESSTTEKKKRRNRDQDESLREKLEKALQSLTEKFGL